MFHKAHVSLVLEALVAIKFQQKQLRQFVVMIFILVIQHFYLMAVRKDSFEIRWHARELQENPVYAYHYCQP